MQAFRRGLSLLLICLAIAGVCGCQRQVPETTIDWDLHGVWVAADGDVQNEQVGVDFSLKGILPSEYELYSTVEMKLNFIWPDSFIYANEGMKAYTGGAGIANEHENQPIYHGGQYVLTPDASESIFLSFTVCPEEGFIVIDMDNKYLVATTDPNADPAEIFAFYKEYVHISA